jgi:hypothetical protein
MPRRMAEKIQHGMPRTEDRSEHRKPSQAYRRGADQQYTLANRLVGGTKMECCDTIRVGAIFESEFEDGIVVYQE